MEQASPETWDTTGLYQAFWSFSGSNPCLKCPPFRRLLPSCWPRLTLTGAGSGMLPLSSSFDDPDGFYALFFRRTDSGFELYCTDTLVDVRTTGVYPDPDG
ncbi:MAG: hypothetical protein EP344_10140 [Bacteroidetes bacterium]|nr:MAG: hypothetical protein EP344_10140 [Bacteroidota bacterium]